MEHKSLLTYGARYSRRVDLAKKYYEHDEEKE